MESEGTEQQQKDKDDGGVKYKIPEWKTYVVMYDVQDSHDPKLRRLLKKYSTEMIENINGFKMPRSVGNFVLIDRECIDPDNTRTAERKADILSRIIENDRRTHFGEEELLPYEDPPETPADQKKKKGKSSAAPAKSKTSKKGKDESKSPPKSPKNKKSSSKKETQPELENKESENKEEIDENKEKDKQKEEEEDILFPYNENEDKQYIPDRIFILTNYPQNEEEYNELVKRHLLQAILYLTEPRRIVNSTIVPQSIPMISIDEFDFNLSDSNANKIIKSNKSDEKYNFVNNTQEIPEINNQLEQNNDVPFEEEKTEEELKQEEEERLRKEEEERKRIEEEEERKKKEEEEAAEQEKSKKRKSVAKENKKGKTKEIETPEIDIAEEMRKKIGIYVLPTKITPSFLLSTIIKCYYENISNEDYRNMIFLQFPIDKSLELIKQQENMMKLICNSGMQYYKYQKWRFELPMYLSTAVVADSNAAYNNNQVLNNENPTTETKEEDKKNETKGKKEEKSPAGKGKKGKKGKEEVVEEEKQQPEISEEKKDEENDENKKKEEEEEKPPENILETRVYKIYQDYNSRIKFHYNDLITLIITMIDSVAYECIDKAMDLQLHPPPAEEVEEVKEEEKTGEEAKLNEGGEGNEEKKEEEEEKPVEEVDDKKGKKGKDKKQPAKTPSTKEKKRESKIGKKGKKGADAEEEENKEEEKPQIPVIRAPPPLEPAKPVPPLPPETQMWRTPENILRSYSRLKPHESVINLLSNNHIDYNQKSKTIYERNEILKLIIECNLDVRENGLNYYNLYGNNYLEKITQLIDALPIPGFSLDNFPPEDIRIDREKLNIYFTKLHYYSDYPINELKMNDLILQFEDYVNIIDPNVKELWKFNNRRYIEYLDQQCLKQTINELYKHPLSIYLKYLPQYDLLLLLNHYNTPHSRFTIIKDTTPPFDDSHLPTFQQYYNYIIENSKGNEEAIIPVKSHIVSPNGEDLPPDPEFQQLHEHKFIFPSDHSLIEFQPKRINVSYYNYNFGLKPISEKTMEHIESKEEPKYETLSSFYMNFNEGSSLYIQAGYPMPEKNDGYDSILMTYNEMNGNEYDVYSHGMININSIRGKDELNEYCRQWCGNGDMIVYYYYKEPEGETEGDGDGEEGEKENKEGEENVEENKEEEKKEGNDEEEGNKDVSENNNNENDEKKDEKQEEGEVGQKEDDQQQQQTNEEKEEEKEKNKPKFSKMIYHYDGSITIDDPLQELTVYESGEQYLIVKNTGEEGEIDPIEVFEYDDDENNCKIVARKNVFGESLSIEYINENIVRTIYHDGTNIFYDRKKDMKYYYHPFYGTVILYNDHNEVCLKHQNGIKCPMNLSGINPRYKCYTLDGTLLTMNYDTRVIAKYNGVLECLRYDKTLVKGNDGGNIEVIYGKNNKPSYENDNNKEEDENVPPSAREQSDHTIGNYLFNFNEGYMDFHDPEYNHYHVDYNGEHIVELTGILSGCVTETWIDNPLQPQLFIIKRDGSGYELLRNSDVEEYKRSVEYHTNCQKRIDSNVCIESGEVGKYKSITYEWEIGVDRDELYEVYNKCKLPIKIKYYDNMRIDHPFTYKIYRTFYEINAFDERDRNHLKDIINEYRQHMKKIESDYVKYTVDIPEEKDENKTNEISSRIQAIRKKRAKHLRHEEKRKEREEKMKLKKEKQNMLQQKAKEEYQEKIRRSQMWTSPLHSNSVSQEQSKMLNNQGIVEEEEDGEQGSVNKQNSSVLLSDGKSRRITNFDNNYWKSGISPSVDSLPSEDRFKNNNNNSNNNEDEKDNHIKPFDGIVINENVQTLEKEGEGGRDSSEEEEYKYDNNKPLPSVTSSSSSNRNVKNNNIKPERINSCDELNELRTHSSRRIKDRLVNGEIQEISDFIFDKYEIDFGIVNLNSIANETFVAQNVGYLSYRLRVDHPKQIANHKKDENYMTWSLDSTKASPGMKIHLKVKLVANCVGNFNDYVEVVSTHSRFHLIVKAEIV